MVFCRWKETKRTLRKPMQVWGDCVKLLTDSNMSSGAVTINTTCYITEMISESLLRAISVIQLLVVWAFSMYTASTQYNVTFKIHKPLPEPNINNKQMLTTWHSMFTVQGNADRHRHTSTKQLVKLVLIISLCQNSASSISQIEFR